MRDFHRGLISARRLQVLIDWLPEGSALHRARAEGKTMTLSESVLWQMYGQLVRANAYAFAGFQIKKNSDKFSWPASPWEESEKQKRVGAVAAGDQRAALDYLMSLSPRN